MLLPLLLLLQTAQPARPSATPSPYAILKAEYERDPASPVFAAAVASGDTVRQRLAARALGRLEHPELASLLAPLLSSPAVSVRREAANALGQLRAGAAALAALATERDGAVRAVLFESLGRAQDPAGPPSGTAGTVAPPSPAVVDALVRGLTDTSADARLGAARGLESLLRRTARVHRPSPRTVLALRDALRDALRENTGADMRQLLVLALTASADRDSATLAAALRDTSAQVRRLAVAAGRMWVDDPSPLVRYQALRAAGTCARAAVAVHDVSAHVALAAIDLMGEQRCDATRLDSLVQFGADWRVQSRALVALAAVDSARARARVPQVAASPVWQARAYAATAAVRLHDEATRTRLLRDTNPNVVINALRTTDDAVRALTASHAGLALAGATRLKGDGSLATHVPALLTALTAWSTRPVTRRDPRIAILQRLGEAADSSSALQLRRWLRDQDPAVAMLAATVIQTRAHVPATAVTMRYAPPPFPSEATLRSLRGATATLVLQDLGTLELTLLPDEAPATVAMVAALADRGAYNGLTWHRIVPNFVLQGGSPGADEYDPRTDTFMRDEVGLARHARGTFGISTRGRDTGDGQLFINLVDNQRLDHDYTVFATLRSGWDVMDRVQEGAVITSFRVRRR